MALYGTRNNKEKESGKLVSADATILFGAMTYLTQQVRLLDTAPQLLIQKAFGSVIFTDSDDTLKSGGWPEHPCPTGTFSTKAFQAKNR